MRPAGVSGMTGDWGKAHAMPKRRTEANLRSICLDLDFHLSFEASGSIHRTASAKLEKRRLDRGRGLPIAIHMIEELAIAGLQLERAGLYTDGFCEIMIRVVGFRERINEPCLFPSS